MNGAWIAVALLGAFGLFSWAENKSATAASTAAEQNTGAASTNSLLNSIASLLKGTSSSGKSSSGSSGSGGSGSSGSFGSGSSANSSGSAASSETGDSDAVDQAELGVNEDGTPISFDPTDTDSTGLIGDAPAPVYLGSDTTYTPPDDSDDSGDGDDFDDDDWD